MGFKTFSIVPGQSNNAETTDIGKSLENDYYKVDIDESKGVISSIYDKELQIELVDPLDSLSLGNFIYEELQNRHEMERLTASRRDTVYKPLNLKRSLQDREHLFCYLNCRLAIRHRIENNRKFIPPQASDHVMAG